MKFRFEFDIKKMKNPISFGQKIFMIGSCFTENMAEKLSKHKFSVLENPYGILFNPVSVCETINLCNACHITKPNDLFYFNEAWHSWRHHGRFSGIDAEKVVESINSSTMRAHEWLRKTDVLMITLGSAWVYTLTDKALNPTLQLVAANNHKAPAAWFEKRILSPSEVFSLIEYSLLKLWETNPKASIIFTISPVRHIREGAVENNRSKACLIQAVHNLIEKYSDKTYYFPAYELIIDDLRDYRFFAEDLVHPNYFATQYVWEKWIDACFAPETKELMEKISAIQIAKQHKAFKPHSQMHKAFLEKYLYISKQLQERYPEIDLGDEIEYFGGGL